MPMNTHELAVVFQKGAGIINIRENDSLYADGIAAVLRAVADEYDRLNYHLMGKGWTSRWLRAMAGGGGPDETEGEVMAREVLAVADALARIGRRGLAKE